MLAIQATIHHIATTVLLASALTACGTTGGKIATGSKADSQTEIQRPPFASWLRDFKATALAAGIQQSLLDSAFVGVEPREKVIKADKRQAEVVEPMWVYLDKRVSDLRVSKGRQKYEELGPLIEKIGSEYGVAPSALIAIWGMETNYGGFTGNNYVIEALATLAWEGRRSEYFSGELLKALQILQNGDIDRANFIGSWAGAMGQPQFMPSSYMRTAVDYDGDGRRNIWTSEADTLASIAAYLKNAGWKAGGDAAIEVRLPQNFDVQLADGSKRTVAEWQQLGIRSTGNPLPPAAWEVTIDLPAGLRGPAFMVTRNLRAIRRYNNSTKYALAVNLIAQQIRGGMPIVHSWPVDEPGLTRDDVRRLQAKLNEIGIDAGPADGLPGSKTRFAIRQYQIQRGLSPDGFPTQNLLRLLGLKIDIPVVPEQG